MNVRPIARGLLTCEQIVVEAVTNNVSLINCFTSRHVGKFPSPPMRFAVFAMLTGGLGTVRIKVEISPPNDSFAVYTREVVVPFADKSQEVRFSLRLTDVVFPMPGEYWIQLLADGEWIAQTRLRISK